MSSNTSIVIVFKYGAYLKDRLTSMGRKNVDSLHKLLGGTRKGKTRWGSSRWDEKPGTAMTTVPDGHVQKAVNEKMNKDPGIISAARRKLVLARAQFGVDRQAQSQAQRAELANKRQEALKRAGKVRLRDAGKQGTAAFRKKVDEERVQAAAEWLERRNARKEALFGERGDERSRVAQKLPGSQKLKSVKDNEAAEKAKRAQVEKQREKEKAKRAQVTKGKRWAIVPQASDDPKVAAVKAAALAMVNKPESDKRPRLRAPAAGRRAPEVRVDAD
jgi:hypothetical protein